MSNEMGSVSAIEQRNRTESEAKTTATIEKSAGADDLFDEVEEFRQEADTTVTSEGHDEVGCDPGEPQTIDIEASKSLTAPNSKLINDPKPKDGMDSDSEIDAGNVTSPSENGAKLMAKPDFEVGRPLEDDSSSDEEPAAPSLITVMADVHAEADFDPGEPQPFDIETPESLMKPGKMPSMDPKLNADEIIPIQNDVEWKTVSLDIEKYRIKVQKTHKTCSLSESDSEDDAKVSKSLTKYTKPAEQRKNSVSTFKRLSQTFTGSSERHEFILGTKMNHQRRYSVGSKWSKARGTKKSSNEEFADREMRQMHNNSKRNKTKLNYCDDSDGTSEDDFEEVKTNENQENMSPPSGILSRRSYIPTPDVNQNSVSIENRNRSIQQSPKSKPLSESNQSSDFDALFSTPDYQKGQLARSSTISPSRSLPSYCYSAKRPRLTDPTRETEFDN